MGISSIFEDGGRGDSGEEGFHIQYIFFKKYSIVSSSIFDGITKLQSGFWGTSPTKNNENFRYPAFASFF